MQRHRAVDLAVVVLGLPALPTRQRHVDRLVFDRRAQGELLRTRQRRQVDGRLDQRTDRPHCVQRAIETDIPGVAVGHQCLHLAVLRGGHDQGALQAATLYSTRLFDDIEALAERTGGLLLDPGVERRKDAQPFGSQIIFAIIPSQLPPDQFDETRDALTVQGARLGDPQPLSYCRVGVGLVDETLRQHLSDHQVAPFQRTLRMSPWVVERCPLDQPDQQRCLVQAQLAQWPVEIEIGTQTKAMDRTATFLAKEDLVGIGLQNLVFAVAGIDHQGHQRFVGLAPQ